FYSRAVELDALQSEAHYNLGYLELDAKRPENAVRFFTVAVTRDPKFADAHFNLAVALAETGQTRRAREHWRRYLEIEPTGAWAETARGYLSNEPAPA
ncbi:MAG: tetratricopeptide repeat protein, partial [Polyangiaceae bacterium]|nr:tetratricopeptide repeat protein [Polyangiaceae bacterium]